MSLLMPSRASDRTRDVVAQTIPRALRLNAPPVWLEALGENRHSKSAHASKAQFRRTVMTRHFITGAAQAVKDSPQGANKSMEGRADITKGRGEREKKRAEAAAARQPASSKKKNGPRP